MDLGTDDVPISSILKSQLAILDHKTAAIWATACAEHVLPLFEAVYPQDMRPRTALEAGRAWAKGNMSMFEARKAAFASHDAARKAKEEGNLEASEAAKSCSHACSTAHVKDHALPAAAYAIKAAKDKETESKWQMEFLQKLNDPS
ncbi:hypothetical protein SpiGrapes_1757 [Sphaerochaeta pleomorpha str. Grapes]|uniref:Imm-5-like domain-containing protein n=1 Tax=Sphaerochaeta pleomorpha (strain ATCC BAA-1885 / DSM 22778 / Grapes) TaxID=158190 RepID=G8QXJ1_SPHPG|nr:hypothetical protein [Sphaerochaeta pleomorpha]AEV29554.1 hypothetical protein SpiGrapes_1757 [Sphaerochaeta pleomorpha str. Grapes]